MARHRLITLLGLTSIVATMVTITRYSSSLNQSPGARLMISQQRLLEYQHKLRLIASEHNSNQTYNNLLDNLMTSYRQPVQSVVNSVSNSDTNNDIPVLKDNSISVIPSSSPSPPPPPPSSSVIPVRISARISSTSSSPQVPVNQLIPESAAAGANDNVPSLTANSDQWDTKPLILPTKAPTLGLPVTEKPTARLTKVEPNIQTNNGKNINSKDINNDIDVDPPVPVGVAKVTGAKGSADMTSNEKQQLMDSLENNENEKKLSKIKFKPKLVFDGHDLNTTDHMLIDKPLGCDDDMGASLDLLVLVNSAVDHWEARAAIRDTWGKFAVERGAYVLYLLGSSADHRVQRRVLEEDSRYGDILQGQYLDNYFNLTLKTISMMKWLSDRCSKVKYALKVDDDMFVNMQHITDFSETRNFNKCIIGKLAKKWKPHRNTNNKWYVPTGAFNGTTFPTFATGPAYMISGDAARPLYETSIKEKPMYLEDVYMTGIVAERAGIRRLNHAMFRNTHVTNVDECSFRRLMTSHKHSPQDIRRLWDVVYREPQKVCSTPAPKTVKPAVASNPGVNNSNINNNKVPVPVIKSINSTKPIAQSAPVG
ncbi:unnamed protein product [Oppiella nova]|uniref:Hexosyltransferase n=1 Tax=Oppiella nova TaxID=334625 RepID=A0A7R9LWP1_9ACAR|nr:unnamed protein product [Oppiella nova]CAG2167638.1 unnamed protein product [Oppiella nova]